MIDVGVAGDDDDVAGIPAELLHPLEVTAERRLLHLEDARQVRSARSATDRDCCEEVHLRGADAVSSERSVVDAGDDAREAADADGQALRRDQEANPRRVRLLHRASGAAVSTGRNGAPAH